MRELKIITKVKTIEIYEEIVERISKPPTSMTTWIDLFPFLEKYDWSISFELPYKILREPYFQSFQYKILHRIVNCRDNLFKWNIANSPNCNFCTDVDTIEHHFYDCKISQNFWKELKFKLKSTYNREFKFTICEILLGLNMQDSSLSHCINSVIIWGKWYINKNKSCNKAVLFKEFVSVIKSKLNILQKLHSKEKKTNKFNKIYKQLYENL